MKENKWIDFKKKKPEKEGLYLVYAESGDPNAPLLLTTWWDKKRWHLAPIWNKAISYWMDLPDPPD